MRSRYYTHTCMKEVLVNSFILNYTLLIFQSVLVALVEFMCYSTCISVLKAGIHAKPGITVHQALRILPPISSTVGKQLKIRKLNLRYLWLLIHLHLLSYTARLGIMTSFGVAQVAGKILEMGFNRSTIH
jgi:hypothetical protein